VKLHVNNGGKKKEGGPGRGGESGSSEQDSQRKNGRGYKRRKTQNQFKILKKKRGKGKRKGNEETPSKDGWFRGVKENTERRG